ncbi:FAD-dependent oxidoreductase [soil metagenome]
MTTKNITSADFVIIGAGIVGLTIARELKQRSPAARIIVLEKEPQLGLHASGRNSGVLHSGIYYPENSLKAKVCAAGAKAMAEYCDNFGLPINRTGKVIIPTKETDESQLQLLYQRGINNGAKVELIDAQQLKEIEPMAYTATGQALYSPDTAVIDSKAILLHLSQTLQQQNVVINFSTALQKVDKIKKIIYTSSGKFHYGHAFNTAGLYADKVAKAFGAAKNYTMLPFKGIYYRLDPQCNIKINQLIYPVPDLNVPFLGVHFTKLVNGEVMAGPTAVPALGRENYYGVKGINPSETMNISCNLLRQYYENKQGFRTFAHQEAGRFLKKNFAAAARALVPTLKPEFLLVSQKVGIRAQLLDLQKRELIMDFLIEQQANDTHVLNAVSPAFTCSLSFAKLVVDRANYPAHPVVT